MDTPQAGAAIICADDDPVVQFMYNRVLTKKGYDVRVCADGDEVITAFEEQPADLVIVDLNMPRMSGLQVTESLRRNPRSYNVPVIIVSASDTEESISAGLTAGADDYLIKPIKPAELLAKTTMILRKKEMATLSSQGVAIGSLFNGRYEVLKQLGVGGSSTVYYAKDVSADATPPVALKILDFGSSQRNDSNYVKLFLREAYEHANLDHPNVVKLFDFGQFAGAYFLVMEYVEGLSVEEIVKTTGPMDESMVCLVGSELAQALAYIDQKGLIHRDIKPRNIMVTIDGDVKLLDFGLARRQIDETLSLSDEFKGTPHFVSPEYIRGVPDLDIRTDIYSLGVTLYYAISKVLPFKGSSAVEIIENHLRIEPLPLTEVLQEVRPEFSDLIARMVAKKREDRPEIDELVDTLGEMVKEHFPAE